MIVRDVVRLVTVMVRTPGWMLPLIAFATVRGTTHLRMTMKIGRRMPIQNCYWRTIATPGLPILLLGVKTWKI
jgi:hypothetical protein